MGVYLIYAVVTFLATTAGACAGLGGGVIMKPVFDLVGAHDAAAIGFYASAAVFTMCIVSIGKQIKQGFHFDGRVVAFISVGSLVGGFLGERVFGLVAASFDNRTVKAIQAALLGVTLVLILLYTRYKDRCRTFTVQNLFCIGAVGVFLGSISVFLGIGGGPINVATLMLFFSYPIKEATVYSLATIFFSQISKLGYVFLSGEYTRFDLRILPPILLCAVLGGFVGTAIQQKSGEKRVERIYLVLNLLLIGLSGYNVVANLI